MNNKFIFFSDMDGTLLNDEKRILPRTKEAIHQFMEKGNVLALSSGRPLNSILEAIEVNGLHYENLYAIAYNGTLIYHCKSRRKISEKVLPMELIPTIQKICQTENVYCQTYDDSSIIVPYQGEEVSYYTKTIHLPVKVLPDFSAISVPPCKMLCIDLQDTNKLLRLADILTKDFGNQVCCLLSRPTLLEIFPASSGKGTAVKELCDYLQIPIANSYSAGDEQNDISMLQAANHSIAMANATDKVKSYAKYVTKFDNNHDGLASFFEEAVANN